MNHAHTQARRLIAISLGLFVFSIYLLAYRGGFHSVDEVSMFAVTENLVKFGQVHTDQIAWTQWTTSQAEAQGFFGRDGHVYSKKGLALSLAQAPLYLIALYLPGIGMLQTVSLLNAGLTALTVMLIFMFAWRLGYGPVTAVATALIYGVATIAIVYAKYLFSEPLAGFLLLLTVYMLFVYRQEGGGRHTGIAGLAAGFAVLTRANNLFLLPAFGLYLLWVLYHRPAKPSDAKPRPALLFSKPSLAAVLSFGLGLALPGLILLTYNALRSGNPLETGYDLTLFSSNFGLGLYKLLFSPLRGLFVYSPILLLSLPGWWRFQRMHRAEAWLMLGCVSITLGLFSFWSSGEGLSWGSRFLVPVVPFFGLMLAPIVDQVAGRKVAASQVVNTAPIPNNPPRHHTTRTTRYALRTTSHVLRPTFYTLLSLSLLIHLLGIAINPWVYLAQLQADFGGEFFLENTAALYDFRYSQIVGQLQSWSLVNADLAWLRWGFDPPAFG
ncbi:MAG: phospholipid carrier-dependent glycosyltransferase, partial [Anaerolineae bacterium]|nr:phospholipid carrier-dependent glycosyltransferase [Anaerolineae bacterium]